MMDYDADQPGCSQHNDTSTEDSCLDMSEESQKDEPVFGCGECLNLFKEPDCAKKCFYRHAIIYFSCKACNAKFSLKNNLKSHLLTHTGYVPLKFKFADTLFSPSGTCTCAQLIRCGVRSVAFSETRNQKTHICTHTGKRPVKCEHCNAVFCPTVHLNVSNAHSHRWTTI